MANNGKKLPKARDVDLATNNVPRWYSQIPIPPLLAQRFDVNPGLVGGLTPKLMEKAIASTEGKLLQVEMGRKFKELLDTDLEAHKEIETIRLECVKKMYETATAEDALVMEALLAGTKYEEHLVTWKHELAGQQNFVKEKGKLDRDYLSQDFKNRLLMAAEQSKKRTEKSNNQVENSKSQINDATKEEAQEDQKIVAARVNLEKLLKR